MDRPLAPALRDVLAWRADVIARSSFQCVPIDFAESKEWRFEDGHLRHRTGGFFSLAGLEAEARYPRLNGREQLIILQPLVGINGFLVRRGMSGPEILFQGRVEPGNVGAMQLAPTVQSTQTNYKRLHGGGPTPLVEWFLTGNLTRTLFDEPQSEEASRYCGKYNRNVVLEVPAGVEIDLPFNFRWYGTDSLRSFATADNVLNTDARSVLSCMPWQALANDGAPFADGSSGTFASRLRVSYQTVGRVILAAQVRGGILHFLLRASHEIGYLEGIQLSTPICIAPGETFKPDEPLQDLLMAMIDARDKATIHLRCRQSEEGGRFYQDENDYEVIEVDEGVGLPDSPYHRWVTLGQIRRLIQTPGVLAMELRGALALLLACV